MNNNNESIKNNKTRIMIITLAVTIFLMLAIGISYATWRYNFTGQLTDSITTVDIKLEFLEDQENIINITNALPLTDEEGKKEDTFDFAVTSKTSKNTVIKSTLSIEKLAVDSGYTFLSDNDVKVYLEDYNGNTLVAPTKISNLNNYKLYTKLNQHNSNNETIKDEYKLRVWIDESKLDESKNWTQDTKLQYKFKINVNGEEVQ